MRIVLSLFLTIVAVFAIELRVGSENAYKPFAYINEDGIASGFDNDVLKILATYIPEANLTFHPVTWNAIFSSLDASKFDIVANQITKTKEREEKYIFSQQPYFYDISTLISLEDAQINDIWQLQNAKIGVTVGSNHAKNLEEYLKKHPDFKAQIVYYKTSPSLVADLKNKRVAAIVNSPIAAKDYVKAQNIKIHISEFNFEKMPVFLIFRKDSQALATILDEALQKALEDGKISKLSIEYFGIDLSK